MSSTDYVSLNKNKTNYQVYMGKSCYDIKTFGDKPRFHWIIWCSGFFAILLLIFSLLMDSITLARFESQGNAVAQGLDYKMSCGWKAYDGKSRGFNNELYTICNGVQCQKQFTSGKLWLAFGILACFPIPLFLFGFYKDYYDGIIDGSKPIDYFKWWCCCQNLGFTLSSILYIFVFETLMIFLYIFTNTCKKEEFWDEATVAIGRVNFKTLGGPSMAFAWMSWLLCLSIFIQVLVYQYTISAELPTAPKKEPAFKFQMHSPKPKEPPKPKPKPKEATGEAPNDGYFKPKSNVTNTISGETYKSNNNISNNNNGNNKSSKPSGPPPVPTKKQRPAGLPPRPN